MIWLLSLLLLILCLGVWWCVRIIRTAHAEHLQREAQNAQGWRELAMRLSETQSDAANRLLIRSGVAPAPTVQPDRQAPQEIPHEPSDDEWAAQDEQAEIEANAREALANPFKASLLEDAALYDPHWQKVLARYRELKGQQVN